jgi:pimeloyl-ACP methyl ester carboxylesterase
VQRLAGRYRVLALDARGHGKSEKPHVPEAYGREMAWDVLRLLDHLTLPRAHLVGYSMGAHMTAQLLVHAPDRLLTGTLGGAAGRVGWTDADDRLAELESREMESGSLRSQILRLTPPGRAQPTEAQIRSRSRNALAGQDLAAMVAIRRANRGEAVTEEEMAGVGIPVMPSLQLVVVEGGTHGTTAGRADFMQAVEKFLASAR